MILKAVVKRFFNEKEVTSTLVMDALYSGCKALDYRSRSKKGNSNGVDMEEVINPLVCVDKDAFVLTGDVLSLLERAVSETLPPYKDDKGPQNRTKVLDVLLFLLSLHGSNKKCDYSQNVASLPSFYDMYRGHGFFLA